MTTRTKIVALAFIAVIFSLALMSIFSHAPVAQNTPITVSYSCDSGKTITAVYYQGKQVSTPNLGQPPVPTGSVAISLSDGRTMTLPQTISADGARYANMDESFVFWSKGNGALVLENGKEKSYTGCIMVVSEQVGQSLPRAYSNSAEGFSIRLPKDYAIDASYKYQEFGPGKDISGVKFTIPKSTASGTNLGSDTGMTVEEIPNIENCTANLFLDQALAASTVVDGGTTYSVASSTGAGAGNRYEETVYALPGTNPCIAVRYFIHYGVIENYPVGVVHEFNKQALLAEFDSIRRTLTVR